MKKLIQKIGVMNLILIVVGISLLTYTVVMIRLFKIYGMIPETLTTCVFATLGGECGILGWIKTTKSKQMEREWKLQDKEKDGKKMEEIPATANVDTEHERNNL